MQPVITAEDPVMGDVSAMLRLMKPLHEYGPDPVQNKRRLVADYFRLIGTRIGAYTPPDSTLNLNGVELPPRLEQTLRHLLRGDSEKQIALKLGLSRHTVHVYVKALYKHFSVSSRAELLARWVKK